MRHTLATATLALGLAACAQDPTPPEGDAGVGTSCDLEADGGCPSGTGCYTPILGIAATCHQLCSSDEDCQPKETCSGRPENIALGKGVCLPISDIGEDCASTSLCVDSAKCLVNRFNEEALCYSTCPVLGDDCAEGEGVSICLPINSANPKQGYCLFPPQEPVLEPGSECSDGSQGYCPPDTVCASNQENRFVCVNICSLCSDGVRKTLDCPEGQICADYGSAPDFNQRIGLCINSDRVFSEGQNCFAGSSESNRYCEKGLVCESIGFGAPTCNQEPLPDCSR